MLSAVGWSRLGAGQSKPATLAVCGPPIRCTGSEPSSRLAESSWLSEAAPEREFGHYAARNPRQLLHFNTINPSDYECAYAQRVGSIARGHRVRRSHLRIACFGGNL